LVSQAVFPALLAASPQVKVVLHALYAILVKQALLKVQFVQTVALEHTVLVQDSQSVYHAHQDHIREMRHPCVHLVQEELMLGLHKLLPVLLVRLDPTVVQVQSLQYLVPQDPILTLVQPHVLLAHLDSIQVQELHHAISAHLVPIVQDTGIRSVYHALSVSFRTHMALQLIARYAQQECTTQILVRQAVFSVLLDSTAPQAQAHQRLVPQDPTQTWVVVHVPYATLVSIALVKVLVPAVTRDTTVQVVASRSVYNVHQDLLRELVHHHAHHVQQELTLALDYPAVLVRLDHTAVQVQSLQPFVPLDPTPTLVLAHVLHVFQELTLALVHRHAPLVPLESTILLRVSPRVSHAQVDPSIT